MGNNYNEQSKSEGKEGEQKWSRRKVLIDGFSTDESSDAGSEVEEEF
jgi:hypothetical protein